MAKITLNSPRSAVSLLVAFALMVGAASAGQVVAAPNGLVVLLNVSTDGRTLTITPIQPGVVAPPSQWMPPPAQWPMLPPPPPVKAEPPAPPKPEVRIGGVVDVFTVLNVRTGPGTDNPIIDTLPPGTPVKIVGKQGDWFKILHKGREAWICGDYVWTPGEGAPRNGAISDEIRKHFGPNAIPAPRPEPRDDSGGGGNVGQRADDGGLKIPLYNQNAIGARVPSGFCGPTSLKMVLEYHGIKKDINYLGDRDVGGATPVYTSGQGAGHQAMLDMLKHCGLNGSYMTHAKSIDWLRQQTAGGNPVVVSVRGNFGGGYTTSGHILVVSGVTSDGRIILNDSAGGKRRIVSGSMFLSAWNSSNRMAIVAKR